MWRDDKRPENISGLGGYVSPGQQEIRGGRSRYLGGASSTGRRADGLRPNVRPEVRQHKGRDTYVIRIESCHVMQCDLVAKASTPR